MIARLEAKLLCVVRTAQSFGNRFFIVGARANTLIPVGFRPARAEELGFLR